MRPGESEVSHVEGLENFKIEKFLNEAGLGEVTIESIVKEDGKIKLSQEDIDQLSSIINYYEIRGRDIYKKQIFIKNFIKWFFTQTINVRANAKTKCNSEEFNIRKFKESEKDIKQYPWKNKPSDFDNFKLFIEVQIAFDDDLNEIVKTHLKSTDKNN